jgi:FAD/FMN-containing dehydrogenase
MTNDLKPSTIANLDEALDGRVIRPDDPGYDQARQVFYGGHDLRPAIVVRAAGDDDVARTLRFATETGLELAVRSGGHSGAGHGSTEGGIQLDLAELRELDIDVDGRTAWVGSGLTAAEYTVATGAHGLATGFGDSGSVGIGGITVGGGVGFLVRQYGMTIDSLLAADVVTADGRLVRTDAETEPDLFWAIRGGGGNFGVVTRLRFRLHPVGTVWGGMLFLPATSEVIAGFVGEAEAAPEELSTIANVMVAPPMPFIPPEAQGKLIIIALMVHTDGGEAGERAMAPFRALATPLADFLRAMPYPEMYMPEEEDYHPLGVARTMFIDRVDESLAGTMVERLEASTATMSVVQLRVLGGAMARVRNDATAFAHRDRRIMANVATLYEHAEEESTHAAWVSSLHNEIRGDGSGAYVNFLGDEGEDRVREAYPGSTWDRLASIKARYDPDNLFHRNQNIPPAIQ